MPKQRLPAVCLNRNARVQRRLGNSNDDGEVTRYAITRLGSWRIQA